MAMRHFYFTQQARILRHRRKIREALQVNSESTSQSPICLAVEVMSVLQS